MYAYLPMHITGIMLNFCNTLVLSNNYQVDDAYSTQQKYAYVYVQHTTKICICICTAHNKNMHMYMYSTQQKYAYVYVQHTTKICMNLTHNLKCFHDTLVEHITQIIDCLGWVKTDEFWKCFSDLIWLAFLEYNLY